MAQRTKGERVLGPYELRGRWRIIIVSADRSRVARDFETEKEARQVVRSLSREMGEDTISVEEAIGRYELYLRVEKENKKRSIQTTVYRLKSVLHEGDLLLRELSAQRCQAYYDHQKTRATLTVKRRVATDSHRNMLAEAKTFLRWCVAKGYLSINPFEDVEGTGKRRAGKPQLRIDEARSWSDHAFEAAQAGKVGAIAALMTLLLGLRAEEILSRVVRDVDDQGRVLWIPDSKTEAGKRTLEIPEILRPFLLRLISSREPLEPIFKGKSRHWLRRWVRRLCTQSRVPLVCSHAMRGLHGTLAIERGSTGHAVASALGHESTRTSFRHYVNRGTAERARQRRALSVLAGQPEVPPT